MKRFTNCYTWSDLRENQDHLKLENQKFIELMGETIPKTVAVGQIFLVTALTEDGGTIVDKRFTIPRRYLDFFSADC